MVISGPWGIGKTYLASQYVETCGDALARANLKPVYVSLFGAQTIGEVRSRLAAAALPWWQKWLAHVPIAARFGWVDVSRVGDIARALTEAAVLKNLFVCIDDLERAGAGVRPTDVFGLISELIERRRCKCLLLLNKDKVKDFDAPLLEEKVFDLTLDYRPSVPDLLPIGLSREEDRPQAREIFEAFKCANIRVMKRLDWILRSLGGNSYPETSKIWPTIVRHAAIFVILKYEQGFSRPDLEKVLEYNEAGRLLANLKKEEGDSSEPTLPARVTDSLDLLNYSDVGFDALIIDLLEHGSFDDEQLAQALANRHEEEIHLAQSARMRGFFQILHAGFQTSAADLSADIQAFLRTRLIRPEWPNLIRTCELLLELETNEATRNLVIQNLRVLVTPWSPAEREKVLRSYPAIWSSGILDSISYSASQEKNRSPQALPLSRRAQRDGTPNSATWRMRPTKSCWISS